MIRTPNTIVDVGVIAPCRLSTDRPFRPFRRLGRGYDRQIMSALIWRTSLQSLTCGNGSFIAFAADCWPCICRKALRPQQAASPNCVY